MSLELCPEHFKNNNIINTWVFVVETINALRVLKDLNSIIVFRIMYISYIKKKEQKLKTNQPA